MTPLEEKMKYGLTLVEENGARWMLSELKPVMEEMKKVIESNISDYKLMAGLEHDEGVVAALEGDILNMKQALSKYNELLNK